ncbi:exodeoxyribonuclease VII small subunit [Simiduia curdlanivorans]|uniref:Exodeoxyribonuclease 7 small subunit n=1 Tax=Simiduia curdlanivorans TaxID=1492769 RepID=A0ABV8V274_9GAMM|nr:exodeoxyribonuclease VII small subunit [Simiduia curdlanivorans]MDN3637593.1 exodeoxyribonuclease VII small subunit [Simiduia curdlanivorans]
MASRKKPQDFEQSLAALEALVAKMEKGDLSLEDSLKAFEEGVQLTRECQARLQAAEQRVQVLLAQNGDVRYENLDGSEQED